jgi:hypothetical protein
MGEQLRRPSELHLLLRFSLRIRTSLSLISLIPTYLLMPNSLQVITLILVIVTAALHIYFLTIREHRNFRGAIVHGLGSTISFCLAALVIWPVAALLSYHLRVSFFELGLGLG